MRIDIEALRVLDVVIKEGSFSKAAKSLHRTQSAVSYQIKKLEEQLDLEIFDRSKHRAELTPQGKSLLAEGRMLLQQAARIETFATYYSEGWEPQFELVIDASLPLDPIMKTMQHLIEKNIPTKLQVKVETLGTVQHRFEKDNANMMLVKDFRPKPHLKTVPLPEIIFALVVSKDHPLALEHSVSLNQLLEHVELTVHDSRELNPEQLDAMQFGGEKVFYLHGFNSKKVGLTMGLGFGWMPIYLIQDELQSGQLVELSYQGGSRTSFRPLLVYPTNQRLGKAGQLISNMIAKEFGTYLDQFSD